MDKVETVVITIVAAVVVPERLVYLILRHLLCLPTTVMAVMVKHHLLLVHQ